MQECVIAVLFLTSSPLLETGCSERVMSLLPDIKSSFEEERSTY